MSTVDPKTDPLAVLVLRFPLTRRERRQLRELKRELDSSDQQSAR